MDDGDRWKKASWLEIGLWIQNTEGGLFKRVLPQRFRINEKIVAYIEMRKSISERPITAMSNIYSNAPYTSEYLLVSAERGMPIGPHQMKQEQSRANELEIRSMETERELE